MKVSVNFRVSIADIVGRSSPESVGGASLSSSLKPLYSLLSQFVTELTFYRGIVIQRREIYDVSFYLISLHKFKPHKRDKYPEQVFCSLIRGLPATDLRPVFLEGEFVLEPAPTA